MKKSTVPIIAVVLMMVGAAGVAAQGSNGTYTVTQDVMSSGGGQVGGGNPMQMQVSLGLPAGGLASGAACTIIGGIGMGRPAAEPPITSAITVSGTVNDPASTVTVNAIPATVSGGAFTAQNVPIAAGPNTVTASARDSVGNVTSSSVTVYLDVPQAKKTPRFPVQVTGTVNDASASVSVNGATATIASGQFTASVMLVTGVNTLTAIAMDPAGNSASGSIDVFVPMPPRPPAMPTVGTVGAPLLDVTTSSSVTFGGTKTPGTSIWINGTQVVAANSETTWTVTRALVEGDNALVIVAKDSTGAQSAAVTRNIVVDNAPPVLTFQPPTKTNLTPGLFTGSVDDSLTTITIGGLTASRTGRDFQVSVPLTLGSNSLTLRATSPNGYVTTQPFTVILGTIPAIQSSSPADGGKVAAGTTITIQITATDAQSDPIQYQARLDGVPLGAWSSSGSQTWTPTLSQSGVHRLTTCAKDGYGGETTRDADILVIRPPIQHP